MCHPCRAGAVSRAIGSMKLTTTRAFEPSYPDETLCGKLQVTGGGGYDWTIVYGGG